MRSQLIIAPLLVVLCLLVERASGIDYELSVVAKQGDMIGGITLPAIESVRINNVGEITFRAGEAIFTPDDVIVKAGDVIDGKTLNDIGRFDVNDMGELVFMASFGTTNGLFTIDELLAEPGTNIGGLDITSVPAFPQPTINNSGTVAFLGDIAGGRAIFTQDQIVAAPFTDIDGIILTQIAVNSPSEISESGRVFFRADSSIGGAWFTQDELVFTTDMTAGGLSVSNLDWITMNAAGDLGLHVIPEMGEDTIVVNNTQLISENSSIGEMIVGDFAAHSLSDTGDVAFLADIIGAPVPMSGVFTPTDKVVITGAIVGGGILESFASPEINNDGEIVFFGYFLDGKTAVILATPVIIPGDYNGDGFVDVLDYVLLRDTLSSTTDLLADGTGPGGLPDGIVDHLDYQFWAENFGNTFNSGQAAGSSVPEPCAMMLAVLSALFFPLCTPRAL